MGDLQMVNGANGFVIGLFTLCIFASGSCIQSSGEQAKWDINDTIPNDEEVRVGTLDNGLKYYIRKNSKPENRAELRLIVNAGSVQERDYQCGLAHFTEHLMFCGTKDYTKEELQNFFELSGMKYGPHANGQTSFDETIFKLQPRTDSQRILKESFRILGQWAHAASFDSAMIEEERTVLMKEWQSDGGPDSRFFNTYLPKLFHGSKYAERLPIGKGDVLKEVCIDSIRNFYNTWYRPNLMAVVAVGDFNVDSIHDYVQSNFSGLKNPESFREKQNYEVPDHDSIIVTINRDEEISFPKILFYYKEDPNNLVTVNDLQTKLKAGLVEKMMKQRYDELRQEKSPALLFSGVENTTLCRNKDAFLHYGFINQSKVMEGFKALATEIERVRQHGFTAGELSRSKETLLSDLLNKRNERNKMDSKIWVDEIENHFLQEDAILNPATEYELAKNILPKITLEEINANFNKRTPHKNLVIVLATGDKNQEAIPEKEHVLATFDSISQVSLPEYVDTFSNRDLEIANINSGTIIDEEEIGKLDLTIWTLSNGARVLVKPTNFKNDEILFSAFSKGGTSLYSMEDFRSVRFLTQLISMSGVGEYSRSELQKILADKNLELIPVIDETHEGIQGKTTPSALETMLKLNYLYFTQPRKDEVAFESFKETQQMIYSNLDANPKYYFYKKFYQTLYQDHPRVQFPTEAELDSLELDRMIKVYKERFANAGDFTFVFVGNVNPDHLRPLVTEYIGGLPTTGEEESFADNGMRYPEGNVKKTIQKGTEPKTTVGLCYTGNFDWQLDNRIQLRALKELIELGMNEELNNGEDGVYKLDAKLKKSEFPVSDYMISLKFTCAPDNSKHLVDKAKAAIAKYSAEGPGPLLAKKVRETMLRTHETELEENMYWLKMLVQYYKHKEDPTAILEVQDKIEDIDREYLQNAASTYLHQDRLVQLVMNPAAQ